MSKVSEASELMTEYAHELCDQYGPQEAIDRMIAETWDKITPHIRAKLVQIVVKRYDAATGEIKS